MIGDGFIPVASLTSRLSIARRRRVQGRAAELLATPPRAERVAGCGWGVLVLAWRLFVRSPICIHTCPRSCLAALATVDHRAEAGAGLGPDDHERAGSEAGGEGTLKVTLSMYCIL